MNEYLEDINIIPDYAIGIVTYVARFEDFFVPLIKQLTGVFPDKEIVCVINGHYDRSLQINYLKNVTAFLSQFPNVHYVTNETNQSLAKCFNWLILMSFAPRILILNDDISVSLLFRYEFEKRLVGNKDLFVINHSWSHFLISKQFVKEVGWFEERLPATGQEDGDYQIRIRDQGKQVAHVACHGIINYIAPQTNAGWANISEIAKGGKASAVNDEFVSKKYYFDEKESQEKLRPGMETPIFYDFSCLDNGEGSYVPEFNFKNRKPSLFRVFFLPLDAVYSHARKTGGKMYRYLKALVKV